MRYFVFIVVVLGAVGLTAYTYENYRNAERIVASEGSVQSISDTVIKIREDDEGLVVLFQKTAGTYYLPRTHESFASARDLLEKSLNQKKPVSVTANSEDLNILEVK